MVTWSQSSRLISLSEGHPAIQPGKALKIRTMMKTRRVRPIQLSPTVRPAGFAILPERIKKTRIEDGPERNDLHNLTITPVRPVQEAMLLRLAWTHPVSTFWSLKIMR